MRCMFGLGDQLGIFRKCRSVGIVAMIFTALPATIVSGQVLTAGAPNASYEPLHAWYDVNQSLNVWEGRTDHYDDEFLVDVRDEATGSGPERGVSYGTNVETWAQFDDLGGDFWPDRVGGFTGEQNNMTTWEVRNAAGWDDDGGWTDEDEVGLEGIGLDGFTAILALNIHEVTSYQGVWNGDPAGPNDDTPILNGVTSVFDEGATDDIQPGKGLLWLDAERAGEDGPVWIMDSGEELVAGSVTLNEWQVHSFIYNGNESQHYIDGELVASGETGEPQMANLQFWSSNGGWHRAGNLDFAEGLFYDEVLSSDSRAGLEQYLSQKWAIGVTATPGDFNGDGQLDAADIDILSAAVRDGLTDSPFDLNSDGNVNEADRLQWIDGLRNTWLGDSNLDGEFNSSDFVAVFTAGEYEDGVAGNSTWSTGDWNGDGEFDSSDFVSAFTSGGYELGPRAAAQAVPEPSSLVLFAMGLLAAIRRRK